MPYVKIEMTREGVSRKQKQQLIKGVTDNWNIILFWGGQIAPVLHHTKASALMRSLIEETTTIMER